jgi:hypothetical protein
MWAVALPDKYVLQYSNSDPTVREEKRKKKAKWGHRN